MVRIKVEEDSSPILQINIKQGGNVNMNASLNLVEKNIKANTRITMMTDSAKIEDLKMEQRELSEADLAQQFAIGDFVGLHFSCDPTI